MSRAIFRLLVHFVFLTTAVHAADPLFQPDATCSRSFVYRNRTYPVDSSRKQDGEGLRFVFKNNNQSEMLLNDYQSRLKAFRWPAYVSTLGIALAIGGPIYANTRETELGKRDTRTVTLFPGIFLAVAAYAYGQFAIQQNEKTLEKAVETYNDAASTKDNIQVGFTPLPGGTGGKVETVVPF